MITARKIRAATAVAATAVLLTLAAAIPATAAAPSAIAPTAAEDTAYPHDWGIVHLSFFGTLQETNEMYPFNVDSRNVVSTPGSWQNDQQKWRLIEVSKDVFRILSVTSGRALQRTGDDNGHYGMNIATTPAWWNSTEQLWKVPGLHDRFPSEGWGIVDIVSVASGERLAGTMRPYSANPIPGVTEVEALKSDRAFGHWYIESAN